MPEFDLLPMDPTVGDFATPKQTRLAREYMGYIDKLETGQMGRLRPADGETLLAPTPWAPTPKAPAPPACSLVRSCPPPSPVKLNW